MILQDLVAYYPAYTANHRGREETPPKSWRLLLSLAVVLPNGTIFKFGAIPFIEQDV